MVTIIPSYMYSIFAALIVGTIIVSSCSLSMVNVKNEAENQQLANVDEYVAAQSLTLITHVTEDGQNATQVSRSSFTNRKPRILDIHSKRLVQCMG